MSSIEGRLFGIRTWAIRWKLLMFGLPSVALTAALISYSLWRYRSTSNKRPAEVEPATENSKEPVPDPQSQTVLDSSTATTTSTTTAAMSMSPPDSGYAEHSTPLIKESYASNGITPPLPLPPPTTTHLMGPSPVRPLLDTMGLRGGRARATVHLPIDIVGRFIGRQGRNIKSLMSESGAQIHVQQKNLGKDASLVPCVIQGTPQQISSALDLVMLRHPEVTLSPHHFPSVPLYVKGTSDKDTESGKDTTSWDHVLKSFSTPSSSFLAIVTYIEKLNRVWLVPYSSTQLLEDLHHSMSRSYLSCKTDETRSDVNLINKYCSVRVSDEYWLRGHVVKEIEEGLSYEVKLMDYGSSVIVTLASIRPLRKEHTILPVQAFPCQLANVHPRNSESEDGMLVLQALVESTVLEIHPTGSTVIFDEGATVHIPLVELYIPSHYGGTEGQAFINRELVNQGFAVWKEVNVTSNNDSASPTLLHPIMDERPIDEAVTTTSQVEDIPKLPLIELFNPSKEDNQDPTKMETSNDTFLHLLSNVNTSFSSTPPVTVSE